MGVTYKTLSRVPRSSLCEADFWRRYVNKRKPVIIEGYAATTPFMTWTVPRLREIALASGNDFERVLLRPNRNEFSAIAPPLSPMSPREFFDRLDDPLTPFLQCYAQQLKGPFQALANECKNLPWSSLQRRGRHYRSRLFVYRNGLTNWHCHLDDETLSLQLSGSKTMYLSPPGLNSERWWRQTSLEGEALRELSIPRTARVATLEPGDAVYIPYEWHHAASASGVGATLALVFRTPSLLRLMTSGRQKLLFNCAELLWRSSVWRAG